MSDRPGLRAWLKAWRQGPDPIMSYPVMNYFVMSVMNEPVVIYPLP
jgi:hypothetical protein